MRSDDKKIRVKLERHLWPDEIAAKNRQKRKFIVKTFISLVVVCIVFTSGFVVGSKYFNASSSGLRKIENVYNLMSKSWYFGAENEKLDEQLIDKALVGMTSFQEDIHTFYTNAEQNKIIEESSSGSFVGIGVRYKEVDSYFIVSQVFPQSPAEKAGLQKGDVFYSVDNHLVKGISSEELVKLVRGELDTKVNVVVLRNEQELSFDIIRKEIKVSTFAEVIDDNIAYLQIHQFGESTAKEVGNHLNNFIDKGCDRIIVDLRGNPGGYITTFFDIASYFIEPNTVILQEKFSDGKIKDHRSNGNYRSEFKKIVILVNGDSASASEAFTIALKDIRPNDVTVVGEKTYGKGTVQQTRTLSDGSVLRLTIAKWLSPHGINFNGNGIEPDVYVQLPPIFHTSFEKIEEPFTIEFDSVDERVAKVQIALQSLGYTVKRTDGYFDESTMLAVKAFQKDNELIDNGKITNDEYEKIAVKAYNKAAGNTDLDSQYKKAVELLK